MESVILIPFRHGFVINLSPISQEWSHGSQELSASAKTFRPGVTSGFSRACMCEPPLTWTSRKQDSYACRFCFGESASEMERVRHPPMLEGGSWPFFRMQQRSDCSLLGKPPSIQLLLLRNHWFS